MAAADNPSSLARRRVCVDCASCCCQYNPRVSPQPFDGRQSLSVKNVIVHAPFGVGAEYHQPAAVASIQTR